jgi:Flp pilus assembly secretin CpaC
MKPSFSQSHSRRCRDGIFLRVANFRAGPKRKYFFQLRRTRANSSQCPVGQSKLITFDTPIERFSVSNPEIAEAVLVAGNQVVVNGKAFGQINFIAWEKDTTKFLAL